MVQVVSHPSLQPPRALCRWDTRSCAVRRTLTALAQSEEHGLTCLKMLLRSYHWHTQGSHGGSNSNKIIMSGQNSGGKVRTRMRPSKHTPRPESESASGCDRLQPALGVELSKRWSAVSANRLVKRAISCVLWPRLQSANWGRLIASTHVSSLAGLVSQSMQNSMLRSHSCAVGSSLNIRSGRLKSGTPNATRTL